MSSYTWPSGGNGSGTGDVNGPGGVTSAGQLALWADNTGTLLTYVAGLSYASNVLNIPGSAVIGTYGQVGPSASFFFSGSLTGNTFIDGGVNGTGGARLTLQGPSAANANQFDFTQAGSGVGRIDPNGNAAFGKGSLAANATNGFFSIPQIANTPTGTPTLLYGGGVCPIVVDATNNKLWVYVNGAWKGVVVS